MSEPRDIRETKLALMPSGSERMVAHRLWEAQTATELAEDALRRFYEPLLRACKTKADAKRLLRRVPACMPQVGLADYVHFQRDWMLTHDQQFGKTHEHA